MSEFKSIIVRPVVKERMWVNTHEFSKDKVGGSNAGKTTIVVEPDINSGRFKTGLEGLKEEELTLFEKELGYTSKYGAGYLNPNYNNPFWLEYKIVLVDEPNVFNTALPEDRLKVAVLKAQSIIASSYQEINADSKFYIEDTEEKTERANKKGELKAKAYGMFAEMSAKTKQQVLKVFNDEFANGTDKQVNGRLYEILEENPNNFVIAAELSKEKLAIRELIYDLKFNGIIREKNGFLYDNDINLGSVDTFANQLGDSKNQDTILTYRERLEFVTKRV